MHRRGEQLRSVSTRPRNTYPERRRRRPVVDTLTDTPQSIVPSQSRERRRHRSRRQITEVGVLPIPRPALRHPLAHGSRRAPPRPRRTIRPSCCHASTMSQTQRQVLLLENIAFTKLRSVL